MFSIRHTSLLLIACVLTLSAQEPVKTASVRQRGPQKNTALDRRYALLNINNVTAWSRYDGHSAHSPSADDGVYFPRGTGSVIYQDCFLWGGKMFVDPAYSQPVSWQHIRVSGGTYGIGTRAGRILDPSFGPAVGTGVEDQNSPEVRVYRIRRDYASASDDEMRRDAADVFETRESDLTQTMIAEVRVQYHSDWTSWPVHKGAPFIDRNHNGMYDPPPLFDNDPSDGTLFTIDSLVANGMDEPGIAGQEPLAPADQVIWTVYNDLNLPTSIGFLGSYPTGMEVQRTYWAYRGPGSVSNTFYLRHRMINKGGTDTSGATGNQFGAFWIDSMYVAQWSDPDVGDAGNDLLGCDTVLQMGYVYNVEGGDREFTAFNLPTPSVGYILLAGPTVPSATDSALIDLHWRRGARGLAFTSLGMERASSLGDECWSYDCASGRYWKALRGFLTSGTFATPDQYVNRPPGLAPTLFPLSGDPIMQTGFIDGLGTAYSFAAGDRRMLINSGPFRMAPGDTQEVVHAFVAGMGAEAVTSVAVMKYHAGHVRSSAQNGFRFNLGPASPHVTATALEGAIVLSWGEDPQIISRTEDEVVAGSHRFEGYNVYELPAADSRLSEGVKLATFDVVNKVTRVIDERIDTASGMVGGILAQLGTNSGIERTMHITRSRLTDRVNGTLLANGTEYYFAVTAYNVAMDPTAIPRTAESFPVVVTVRPRRPFGQDLSTEYGDTSTVRRVSGHSSVTVLPTVVDPTQGTGDTYRLNFDGAPATTWSVFNVTDGRMIVSQAPFRYNDPLTLPEGGNELRFVTDQPFGLKQWNYTYTGSRPLTWTNANGLGLESFSGAIGWEAPVRVFGHAVEHPVGPHRLATIQFQFVTHDTTAGGFRSTADDTASYAYRFVAGAIDPIAQPSFGPWVTAPDTGWAFQDYRISVPFAVYNIDANPPQRLAVGFVENNVTAGRVDGYYWPEVAFRLSGVGNTSYDGPREWLFVFDAPYPASTPNSTWKNVLHDSTIPVMYLFTGNRINVYPWTGGSTMTFEAYRALSDADTLEFTIVAPKTGSDVLTASLDRIGVYPNPYMAYRLQATRSRPQFVTFTNLPNRAVIQVFNLAGHLVRTLRKEGPSQFVDWDLLNEYGIYVGSGMYICRVELPDLNAVRVLKLGVVMSMEEPW